MDPERQRQLTDFVREQLASTPRSIRGLCALGLILCVGGVALLAAVWSSGGATAGDVGVPLVLFLVFTFLGVLGLVGSQWRLTRLSHHPLLVALSAPRPAVKATPASINRWPAVHLELQDRREYIIPMNEQTRAEIMAWLARGGSHVG